LKQPDATAQQGAFGDLAFSLRIRCDGHAA
jgi:hypothetical protein